jgi:SAM-dependent methyltransferase
MTTVHRACVTFAVTALAAGLLLARPHAQTRKPDVIFVATPQPVVDAMLDLAKVTENDTVYDLGCGDGRAVVTAAKRYGARGVGIDLNPRRVRESNANVRRNHVEKLVEIRQANILETDLSAADVVFVYLSPSFLPKVVPLLERLKPGARVVSHEFDLPGIKHNGSIRVIAPPDTAPKRTPEPGNVAHPLFRYVAPLERANSKAR